MRRSCLRTTRGRRCCENDLLPGPEMREPAAVEQRALRAEGAVVALEVLFPFGMVADGRGNGARAFHIDLLAEALQRLEREGAAVGFGAQPSNHAGRERVHAAHVGDVAAPLDGIGLVVSDGTDSQGCGQWTGSADGAKPRRGCRLRTGSRRDRWRRYPDALRRSRSEVAQVYERASNRVDWAPDFGPVREFRDVRYRWV